MNQQTSLGQRIYQLRRERGLSQEDLSGSLNVSRQSISKWETDSSVPDLDKLVALSELFDITLDELVKGTSPVETKASVTEEPQLQEPAVPTPVIVPQTPPPSATQRHPYRKIGMILLAVAVFLGIFLLFIGFGANALLLVSPLLVCGVICLIVRRYPVLWCGWGLSVLLSSYFTTISVFRFYNFDLFSTLYRFLRSDSLPAQNQQNPIAVAVHVVVSVIVIAMMVITIIMYSRFPVRWSKKQSIRYAILAVGYVLVYAALQASSIESLIYIYGGDSSSFMVQFLGRVGNLLSNLYCCMRVFVVTAVATLLTSLLREKSNRE